MSPGAGAATAHDGNWVAFRRLWAAHSVSTVGDHVTLVALPLATYARTESALAVGVVASMEAATALAFGLVAGALGDRLRRRPVLVATDALRAVVLAGLALWLTGAHYPPAALYAAAFLLGILRVVHDAAAGGVVPAVVAPGSLLRANTRLQVSESGATATGPILAGGLLAAGGPALALVVDAVTFAVSGAAMAGVRCLDDGVPPVPASPAPDPAAGRRVGIFDAIVEGVTAVRGDPAVRRAVALMAVLNVVVIVLEAQFVPFAREVLHVGPLAIGLCWALGGMAAVVTSLVVGRGSDVRGDGMVAGAGVMAAGVLVAGLWPSLWTSALAYVLAGAGGAVAAAHFGALRQRRFPLSLQGRVAMTTRLAVLAPLPVAYVAGGAWAGAFGSPALFVLVAVVGLVGVATAAAGGLHRLRMSPPESPVAAAAVAA